jgi:DNA-binding CsgD family transcriptional regulator
VRPIRADGEGGRRRRRPLPLRSTHARTLPPVRARMDRAKRRRLHPSPRHPTFPVLTASRQRSLSEAELRVLKAAAAGLTVDQTADRLERSPETVRTHRKKILARLGAVNMTHAVALAFASEILGQPAATAEPIRDGQLSAFHAKCGALDRRFDLERGTTKRETLARASEELGRLIESANDLSRGEASAILDWLEGQLS